MTKRALISVSDKAGIVEFAQELKKLGWDIISTGGTKVALDNAGVDTIAIDDVTGFPEMMDGRLSTQISMVVSSLVVTSIATSKRLRIIISNLSTLLW